MKIIIVAFALIVAVSCDVSHVVQGDGWFKDETGYHYTVPETRFTEEVADEPAPIVAEYVPEPAVYDDAPVYTPEATAPGCPNGGSGPYCCINGAETEDCGYSDQEQVYEIIEYIDVPIDIEHLRDYLPPSGDAKKKRQTPVRRQVRKVYRRFVRKH
ncbi:unnamed protein product [Chironomus riparius]|uniref:Uncharacterized protein n=1 Tax=Chironomus riparius TaxID=315576 RepID=A0A9N9WPN0_9DIPT|nr:unnamed protein product [Chironomus riparius]